MGRRRDADGASLALVGGMLSQTVDLVLAADGRRHLEQALRQLPPVSVKKVLV